MLPEEHIKLTNELLLDMIKNQRETIKRMSRTFITVIISYTILLIVMVIGFFVYESQFEITDSETTTITQEVSGEDSSINNIEGDQYNDNATHNE